MSTLYRQGDVLLRRTTRQPSQKATTVTDTGRVILAYGEVTGHVHEVTGVDNADPVPAMALFEEPDGSRLLVVRRDALVAHDEHATIALAPGHYEVVRQQEYTPAAIRQVAD